MCGRYHFGFNESNISKQIKEKIQQLSLDDFNTGEIFPNDKAIVLIAKENKLDIDIKTWGIKLDKMMINARIESLNNHFYDHIRDKRCVIIADSFYEWKDKTKYRIHNLDKTYMYLAGRYNDDNHFLIITKESTYPMDKIHHRSPVIMNKKEMIDYLNHKGKITDHSDIEILPAKMDALF